MAVARVATFLSDLAEAYWRASEYSGSGSLLDLSGNGHDAALPGGANNPKWLEHTGTQYIYLPGVSGNYLSTPDSAALDITGDIDLRCAAALDDWTPASSTILVAKYQATGTQRSYVLQLLSSGVFRLVWSSDGSGDNVGAATAVPTVSDGALLLVRATLDVDNGASGRDITFYTKTSTEATARADLLLDTGWTQLGAVVTQAGVTSIFNGTHRVTVGAYDNDTLHAAGKFYAAVIKNGINGTTAFDLDTSLATPTSTTFSEQSANLATVTINRSATGRKTTVVDRDLFLFGTDDYLEVPDHNNLDFAGAESFTLGVACRLYGTTANQVLFAKKTNLTTAAGYSLDRGTGGLTPRAVIADGTTSTSAAAGSAATAGATVVYTAVRNVSSDTLTVYRDSAAGTPVTDTTSATLANAEALRFGRLSGAGTSYGDMQLISAAIFRRALTDAQVADLVSFLVDGDDALVSGTPIAY